MKVLIFDVDGTILDSMPMWLKLENNLLKKYGYTMQTLPQDMKDKIESLSIYGMSEYIAKRIAIDMSVDDVYTYFQSSINKAYGEYLEAKTGAINKIKQLYSSGFTMSIATSSSSDCVINSFERLGIKHCFKYYASPDILGLKKSEIQFWEYLIKKHNRRPENIVLYDDALYDLKEAKKTGIEVVGIKDFPWNEKDWKKIVETSDYTIDSIGEISLDQII